MAGSSIDITDAYPIEMHYIKALFLHQRYRPCIQACRDVLKTADHDMDESPLQQTFINFYLGAAHDELARLMHDRSSAKLPAFKQAEVFYREAIDSLPILDDDVQSQDEATRSEDEDPFTEGRPTTGLPPPEDDDYDPFDYSSPSFPNLSSSPPPHVRPEHDDLPIRSPQTSYRETSSSDLESHASFGQIRTPHRIAALDRDVSRMSLLDSVKGGALVRDASRMSLLDHARPTGLARGVSRLSLLDAAESGPRFPTGRPRSTSQGLLKPIRLGSPPKAFHVPPRLPYCGSAASTSRLPRLNTWQSPASRLPASIEEEREWDAEPPSPVSPLRYGDTVSYDSPVTVSPVSPQTPQLSPTSNYDTAIEIQGPDEIDSIRCGNAVHEPLPRSPEDGKHDRILEHLDALRVQLQTHLRLLAHARQATITAQSQPTVSPATTALAPRSPPPPLHTRSTAAHAAFSRPSTADSKHDSLTDTRTKGTTLGREHSYWSFTPVDVRAEALRARVQAGRARGWARERFEGARYRDLAERAVGEL
ncbi:hypothetical protein LTR53_001032 [Teratosphaeriaceae sp. CCFEE 6253]|nr:hypothetical protein LTR53_001032 [Teratosphaeriaceae sp. CCFEE 6253]